MKAITQHIPNTITCLNLFSGCLAITFAFRGYLDVAVYCIFAAAIFDFLDGFTARLLKAYSPLGLQLDSLADMVTFGVAPSVLLHVLLYRNLGASMEDLSLLVVSFIPFILAVFSGLRLAKFNIDTRQTDSFIGMPTPASTLLIASTVLAGLYNEPIARLLTNNWLIIISAIVLSFLLVSEIPMFSLKFKKQESSAAFFKKYSLQLVFLVVCIASPIIFGLFFIAAMILLYILISIVLWLVKPKKSMAANR
ncbi:MAG: CDP-diacylglycerol--serine O-phosphatidyltransferase [Prevotellaceae bacterium]|nr:CDP-diacylglycerol--serine O-phosphatidyltransferase [Prevotellaceae bacterium]